MLCNRVMRNIQNRHKRIKYMNSFINARRQRKLRKFLENLFSGSQVWVLGPTLRILGPTYELGPGSQVPPLGSRVSSPRSHLWDRSRISGLGSHQKSRVQVLPFGYAYRLVYKKMNSHVYIYFYSQEPIFPNSSGRIRPIKLKVACFIISTILLDTPFLNIVSESLRKPIGLSC